MRDARLTLLALLLLLAPSPAHAQDLTVRVRAPSGKILVGQGIDIFVDVPARDRRPRLALPVPRGARMWIVEETFRPTGMSSIGGATASDNVFTTRLRLVADSPGPLVVPPIAAVIDGRSGKSAPLRLTVASPPLVGRPPGFLGGVGQFTARGEVEPARVRVGQEATYCIRVEGPGAWGMTTRPTLDRLRALPIDARVAERPDEVVDEPPSRSFVYRLRPMKAGEVVIPPVAIASYDPRTGRYITRASNGVRFEVVDAPAFDPTELDYRPSRPGASRAKLVAGAVAAAIALAIAGLALARRRLARWLRRRFPGRARAARAFAQTAARRLDDPDAPDEATARGILDALVEYARLGGGRPPGAMTPGEARTSVAAASGSDALGDRAAEVAARCDRILFAAREAGGGPNGDEGDRLKRDAQELFGALGRSGGRRGRVSGRNGW